MSVKQPADYEKDDLEEGFMLTVEAMLGALGGWVAELPKPAEEAAVGTAEFIEDAVAVTYSMRTYH